MPTGMVLDCDVSIANGPNVLDLLDVRRVAGLVVVVPDFGRSQRVVINETLTHFFFFDAGPCVMFGAHFLPALEKVIDCGTG